MPSIVVMYSEDNHGFRRMKEILEDSNVVLEYGT
jgi:hypothetical protein